MDLSAIFDQKAIAEGQKKALRDYQRATEMIKELAMESGAEAEILTALREQYIVRSTKVITENTNKGTQSPAPVIESSEVPV